MPAIFHNTPGAVLYFLIICVEAVTGSLFILFPLLPFMVLHPVLYRKCVDHLMMLALGLPLALLGWAMQMGNYIFLARKWEKDKPWMEYCFNYYKDLKYGGQYLLFPEAKLIDSVMDITVGYPDLIPTKFDPFSGLFPREVQFNMQRYQVSEFPEEAEKIEQWCIDRWAEKEKYLETFYTEKKSLAEIIGKARENKKPGRHHANNVLQNGKDSPFVDNVPSKQEQNGNSIKPAEEAGTALPSKFRQTLAHTLTKNLVGIYFFWGVFTVYAAVSLYYAPVIRFQCFIALVVFLLAYFVGGFDWYQLMSYNWLKRSKISPQLSLKKLK
ncbi:Lysocardiolipin acyltransferase 1 [Holothuria leucospilota]|uniref:Lysocardiolipin acyltransferase 1 n=1 Tax=Holothuria leucospilota TaxID=206669 RepID=A0A9Q1CIK8_HOLLE|nr:Lysocardiolipin acyltransferase 1 [Holothuria leucospilota]